MMLVWHISQQWYSSCDISNIRYFLQYTKPSESEIEVEVKWNTFKLVVWFR